MADELAAPALTTPAAIASEVAFPTAAWALEPLTPSCELPGLDRTVPSDDRRLVVTDGRSIYAYRVDGTKPDWVWKLQEPTSLTHGAATQTGLFLACGPRAIVAVKLTDGAYCWDFQLPVELPDLDIPVLTSTRLIVRVGNHGLLAFDATTGRVLWAYSANRHKGLTALTIESAPRFARRFTADDDVVLVQRTDGRRWTLAASDGKLLADDDAPLTEWECSPLALGNRRWVIADGPGTLRLITTESGRSDLRTTESDASHTGRLPTYRRIGSSLFTTTSRNYGIELDRLQASNGEHIWKDRKPLFPVNDVDLTAADASSELLILPIERCLYGIHINNGSDAWRVELPTLSNGASWRVRVGRSVAIAYPSAAASEEPIAVVAERMLFRLLAAPSGERLVRLAFSFLAATTECTLPILLFDPTTGKVLQRLDVPTFGPIASVHLLGDTATVVSLGKVAWLRTRR